MSWRTEIARDAQGRKVVRTFTLRPDQIAWLKDQGGNSSKIVRYALDLLMKVDELGDEMVG